jgi:signal peptide peptidase SppA
MANPIKKTNNIDALLPLPTSMRDRSCASQHFGKWAIEPRWFAQAIARVRDGSWKAAAGDAPAETDGEEYPLYDMLDGVAIIRMDGQMTKKGSSFGGCSTIEARNALRTAAADWMVGGILLCISSPGGTVSGTSDLADDVSAVRNGTLAGMNGMGKPCDAYIEDMGCSAAYWIAAQCRHITANRTAVVGSIGTYCVLEDDTAMQEQIGVKMQVVSTGPYKGLGADGKVTPELVADVQREIDELNSHFLAAVQAGRGGKVKDIRAVSDGRAWVADKALSLGLIDAIGSCESAVKAVKSTTKRSGSMSLEQFKAYAAEHPEAVATFIEQGKKAGATDAIAAENIRFKAIREACGDNLALACDLFLAGKDAEDAKFAVEAIAKATAEAAAAAKSTAEMIEVMEKEIERLKAEAGTQAAVGTAGTAAANAAEAPADKYAGMDTETRIEAEWADDVNGCKGKFKQFNAYAGYRLSQMSTQAIPVKK